MSYLFGAISWFLHDLTFNSFDRSNFFDSFSKLINSNNSFDKFNVLCARLSCIMQTHIHRLILRNVYRFWESSVYFLFLFKMISIYFERFDTQFDMILYVAFVAMLLNSKCRSQKECGLENSNELSSQIYGAFSGNCNCVPIQMYTLAKQAFIENECDAIICDRLILWCKAQFFTQMVLS